MLARLPDFHNRHVQYLGDPGSYLIQVNSPGSKRIAPLKRFIALGKGLLNKIAVAQNAFIAFDMDLGLTHGF